MTDGPENPNDWIGRTREDSDTVTPRLVNEYAVVLADLTGPDAGDAAASGAVPPGFHWCLGPDIHPAQDLGRDGHPKPGLVLPRLPLPRRMWAGGAVIHHAALAVGEQVTRRSTVRDIAFKDGRSGQLGFVTVDHVYAVDGQTRIEDRQDIVYRHDPNPDAPAPPLLPGEDWSVVAAVRLVPDATLLFRYSAVTFNGHRIHYDHPYATGIEGYAGLVVHGPLQSTWMQVLAARVFGRPAARFDYRGLSPLTVGHAVQVEARETNEGLDLRVRREADGVVTMQGKATG